MSRKIARITQDKKLLLANEIVEDNRYSLNEHGKLYTKNILEGNKFSIDDEFIEVGELIEGYPFVKPVIDDSLILWLDGSTGNNYEQTGTWKDLSGNGNDGELINFGYTEASGWVDGGLRFDGVDDYVEINLRENLVTINNHTLEAWFAPKYQENKQREDVILGWWGFHRGMLFDSTRNKVNLQYLYRDKLDESIVKVENLFSKYSLPENELTHIVSTFKIKDREYPEMAIYINGYLDNTIVGMYSWSLYNLMYYTNVTRLSHPGRYSLSGLISSARIYNRALTDEEILQNYQAGQCSPLLAMRGDV